VVVDVELPVEVVLVCVPVVVAVTAVGGSVTVVVVGGAMTVVGGSVIVVSGAVTVVGGSVTVVVVGGAVTVIGGGDVEPPGGRPGFEEPVGARDVEVVGEVLTGEVPAGEPLVPDAPDGPPAPVELRVVVAVAVVDVAVVGAARVEDARRVQPEDVAASAWISSCSDCLVRLSG